MQVGVATHFDFGFHAHYNTSNFVPEADSLANIILSAQEEMNIEM